LGSSRYRLSFQCPLAIRRIGRRPLGHQRAGKQSALPGRGRLEYRWEARPMRGIRSTLRRRLGCAADRSSFCPSANKSLGKSDSAMICRGAALMLSEQSSAYDPEELSLLGDIFDRTVASLPATMRTPFNRAEIAKNILTRAAAGERNRIELELAALDNLKVATNSTHRPFR
jgi:hypothetical protein